MKLVLISWNFFLYSHVDLDKAEFCLSGLEELIQKQNDENSQLQNKLEIKSIENNGMVLYCLTIFGS